MEIDFKSLEKKWQGKWEEQKIFEVSDKSKKEKFYVLEMFPYPSGSGLHMGHAWNYTIGDIFARYKIMKGFNVLHPMGYDALGLPAENAAIQNNQPPQDYTDESIKNYIKQQKNLGLSYDWSRCLSSADPDYYKWDQWIFLKMLEKGLAYQKESAVNYCPKCESVLANEQVVDGKCWRHEDTEVEIKYLKQWFFKITDYADELYDEIDNLNWPARTKAMQKNWIGKSFGTEIDFEVETPAHEGCTLEPKKETWPIFTTRPDTIFGVTFMVVSAQHPNLENLVTYDQEKDVEKFLKKIKTVSQKSMKDVEALDKEGVFTGSYAVNPANNEKIPIYAGNFVVADYGSGMVMAVPAHDQRDFEFAKKYGIEIKQVIDGGNVNDRAHTESGKLINSQDFNGLENEKAKKGITRWLEKKKKAREVVQFRLRDWLVSRQRYWGTPIPVIHCENCSPDKPIPVPEKDLPVVLPKNVKFGKGNPLETNEKWLKVRCPKCGGKAKRETDTMDTFVNSSWYYLRYCDSKNDKKIFDKKKANYWCPIDLYIGGAEHSCGHLIYFRFYTKFLADLGLINFREPAKKLFHQGMLNAEGGKKMSKSKGNVVLPEVVSDKYGIDTARYFLCSLASPEKDISWSDKGIQGSLRFVKKVFSVFENVKIGKDSEAVEDKLNDTINEVTNFIEEMEYRKASIKLKELFEFFSREKEISKDSLGASLKLLSPFCPHITEELWEKIGNNKSGKDFISLAEWPVAKKVDKKSGDSKNKIVENVKEIVEKIKEKQKFEKVYVYVLPFELDKIDEKKISDAIGFETKVFAVNDSAKYDPEEMSKKAKPNLPGIYVE